MGRTTPIFKLRLQQTCKGRQAKGGHANKLFRSIYSFISADFGVEPARCKEFMHATCAGLWLHRARLDLFVLGVPQRDAAIKQ